MLFFGYLRGPKMHLWIKKISAQLDQHLHTGGRDTDEWIWDTMINDFAQNFQDVMSQERAEKEETLRTLNGERRVGQIHIPIPAAGRTSRIP